MAIQIENVVVCDLVRMEDTGKHLIIGVYPNDIRFASLPNNINLNIWVQFRVDANWDGQVEVRVQDDKKEILFHARAEISKQSQNKGELLTITVPEILLGIASPTTLSFQIRQPKKRWQMLKQMPVKLRTEP